MQTELLLAFDGRIGATHLAEPSGERATPAHVQAAAIVCALGCLSLGRSGTDFRNIPDGQSRWVTLVDRRGADGRTPTLVMDARSTMEASVIICSRNPRVDYLERVLDGLRHQTLDRAGWELLLVDNGSDDRLSGRYDLSWHPHAFHVREERLGLVNARVRGIGSSRASLLIFVDDDNVLDRDYLEQALALTRSHSCPGVFGAGVIEPAFEIQPDPAIRPFLSFLAIRQVEESRVSFDPADASGVPWGAGLCVSRVVADGYRSLLIRQDRFELLGRRGGSLGCGDDDLFSWVAASLGRQLGVFPQLRLTHLISAHRLSRSYIQQLVRDHALTTGLLHYLVAGTTGTSTNPTSRYPRLLLHCIRRGPFSMRCRLAAWRGQADAARFIARERLRPLALGELLQS
jgi:hypothetical protein